MGGILEGMTDPVHFEKPLLDHGYLKLVDYWGRESVESAVGDEAIIAAARMSTGKGFLRWGYKEKHAKNCGYIGMPNDPQQSCTCTGGEHVPGDENLLRYLWENKHHTPFEMAGLTIEVQAPIFVFREWHRHRVPFSYNEASARYAPLPDLNYVPTVERLMMNSKTNKQAGTVKGAKDLDEAACDAYRQMLEETYARDENFYQWALSQGVPKELARAHLPVGRYSKMRASANLRGWFAFMTLRSAPSAQWEIRQYSDAIGELVALLFPRSHALFREKR